MNQRNEVIARAVVCVRKNHNDVMEVINIGGYPRVACLASHNSGSGDECVKIKFLTFCVWKREQQCRIYFGRRRTTAQTFTATRVHFFDSSE